MRTNRVFVDTPMLCNQQVLLPEAQSHHMGKVLRMQPGQFVHLFNGAGGYYRAEITLVQKRAVTVMPREFIPDQPTTGLRINLAQGISRGRHMDYTIQKAVELGIASIIPLATDYSNVHLSEQSADNKLSHWRNIIISACEQCGRNDVPDIVAPVAFDDWVVAVSNTPRLVLNPAAIHTLKGLTPPPTELTIICGPEGGLSDRELALAVRQNCIAIRLGPRVLRTETAAIAAISASQTLWGDMT
ncbi:MAG: Ribosomal RNA small subunit methyltransferase E [Gammaproteobacteria bacterium]|nr:Ribosomal RNA small subunit methyltransferase E [Gammaproteobacteria bacterium]